MVQYDPFTGMFSTTNLPSRGRDTVQSSGNAEITQENSGTTHPRLRRLSTSRGSHLRCCTKCHMRVPSGEHHPVARDHHGSTSSEEEWDGFCPDIPMPKDLSPPPSPASLKRRHSCLCPENVTNQEQKTSCGSPVQMVVTARADTVCELGHHREKCNCETVVPQENLDERYGLVEEPREIRRKRDSLDKEAANRISRYHTPGVDGQYGGMAKQTLT